MNTLKKLSSYSYWCIIPFTILALTACKDETVEKEQKIEETIIKEPEVGVLPEIDSSLAFIEIPDTSLQKFLIKAGIDSDLRVNGRVYLKDVEMIDSLNVNLISENNNYVDYHTIEGLEQFPKLKKLIIPNIANTTLDLSKFKNLVYFKVGDTEQGRGPSERLITDGAENLKELILGRDIPPGQKVYGMYAPEFHIKRFDFKNNKKLERLVLYSFRDLEELDLSENTALKSLTLFSIRSRMKPLNLKNNINLESLTFRQNYYLDSVCVNKEIEIQGTDGTNYQLKGVNLIFDLYNAEKFRFTHCE